MVGALRPLHHLSGIVISAAVGFVCINLQPNMSFLARLVSDISRSLENSVGVLFPQAPLRKNSARV